MASGEWPALEKGAVLNGRDKAKHYKELVVWQKAMLLAKGVYGLTAKFPTDKRFGLVSQMRRAAVSVPSNIAEGQLVTVRASSCIFFPTPAARLLNSRHNFC